MDWLDDLSPEGQYKALVDIYKEKIGGLGFNSFRVFQVYSTDEAMLLEALDILRNAIQTNRVLSNSDFKLNPDEEGVHY